MYFHGIQSESVYEIFLNKSLYINTYFVVFYQKVAPYQDFPFKINGNVVIMPRFTTDTIEVFKEEEAYSFASLVADIGGVLGLFIGFNFLMIWDWIVWGVKQMSRKYYNK